MARDIEEFLRRAAERRQQKQGQPPEKPAQPRPQSPQSPAARRQPMRPVGDEPIVLTDIEIIEPAAQRQPISKATTATSLRNESVADHVKLHLNSSRLSEQSSHLGERITGVHEQTESRIHQHLDHDISVVDDTPTITNLPSAKIIGGPSGELAAELRQMLQNPKSVGRSIIIAEILKRPSFD